MSTSTTILDRLRSLPHWKTLSDVPSINVHLFMLPNGSLVGGVDYHERALKALGLDMADVMNAGVGRVYQDIDHTDMGVETLKIRGADWYVAPTERQVMALMRQGVMSDWTLAIFNPLSKQFKERVWTDETPVGTILAWCRATAGPVRERRVVGTVGLQETPTKADVISRIKTLPRKTVRSCTRRDHLFLLPNGDFYGSQDYHQNMANRVGLTIDQIQQAGIGRITLDLADDDPPTIFSSEWTTIPTTPQLMAMLKFGTHKDRIYFSVYDARDNDWHNYEFDMTSENFPKMQAYARRFVHPEEMIEGLLTELFGPVEPLDELFDKPEPWQWMRHRNPHNPADDVYRAQFTITIHRQPVTYYVSISPDTIDPEKPGARMYVIAFGVFEDELPPQYAAQSSYALLHNSEVAKPVFATVIAIFKEFLSVKKPLAISFSGDAEPSRIKLYSRFARMASTHIPGYRGVSFGNGVWSIVRHDISDDDYDYLMLDQL